MQLQILMTNMTLYPTIQTECIDGDQNNVIVSVNI